MLWAAAYTQRLDPIGQPVVSTLIAALPVVVLLYLLAWRRWLPSKAGLAGAVVAFLIAWVVYDMPARMAGLSFAYGAGFGLLPVGWTVANAMLLYNLTVVSGQFAVMRRSVGGLSGDARVQAIIIGFGFGAFLEGSAGGGTPVAICGVILVGLGFHPFLAAVLCLIANTSPVAYGGLGTPLIVLNGVTDIPTETLSVMAGHQLPFLSCIIPIYMVKRMCTWKQTLEVMPVLAVAGGSFAAFQYFFATSHVHVPGLILYPMTDVGGGIFSMIVTALFLKFVWRPRNEWHFPADQSAPAAPERADHSEATEEFRGEADALVAGATDGRAAEVPLTAKTVTIAWMPFVLMSMFLMLTGFVRQVEDPKKADGIHGPVTFGTPAGEVSTNYFLPVEGLHKEVSRADRLKKNPGDEKETESAVFNFPWLTAPGTPVLFASLATILMLRIPRRQIAEALKLTAIQMKVAIPTIAFMLGLSYITRYAGMDATLGIAFAETGVMYPFFAAILGWLGVFLTGTDAGSNALFGSLQKITATEVHNGGAMAQLTRDQAQVLICTANSTGGVMGKMIDAQSIVVATSATQQIGKEADIFWAVVWHSVFLASLVGLLTLVQAYVYPFTLMVPSP